MEKIFPIWRYSDTLALTFSISKLCLDTLALTFSISKLCLLVFVDFYSWIFLRQEQILLLLLRQPIFPVEMELSRAVVVAVLRLHQALPVFLERRGNGTGVPSQRLQLKSVNN